MIDKLVAKLYRGECSEEEIETLFNLLKERDIRPSDGLLRKIWEEANGLDDPQNELRDGIFARIESELNENAYVDKVPTNVKRKIISRWMLAAASIALLVLAGSFYFGSQALPAQVVQTKFGEQQSIKFLDGSHLRLNANSKVTYAAEESWRDGKSRSVYLEGEAYFNVEKKPASKQLFQVQTQHALVEVLGTAFNVHSTDDRVKVYLEHGSVQLHLKSLDTTIIMRPGDLVTYIENTQQVSIKKNEAKARHTSWKDGVLSFKDSPLREVIDKIEQIYGVKFQMENSAHNDRILEFPMPIDSLETAISILDKTLPDLQISRKGTEFIVH